MNEDIVTRIRKVIEHYELTVSSFANTIQVQRSSISHILSGRNKPSLDFVMKLIQAFPEVNLYWLLNGKGNFPPAEESEIHSIPSQTGTQKPKQLDIPKTAMGSKQAEPVQIVVLYSDGSFETFQAKKS